MGSGSYVLFTDLILRGKTRDWPGCSESQAADHPLSLPLQGSRGFPGEKVLPLTPTQSDEFQIPLIFLLVFCVHSPLFLVPYRENWEKLAWMGWMEKR